MCDGNSRTWWCLQRIRTELQGGDPNKNGGAHRVRQIPPSSIGGTIAAVCLYSYLFHSGKAAAPLGWIIRTQMGRDEGSDLILPLVVLTVEVKSCWLFNLFEFMPLTNVHVLLLQQDDWNRRHTLDDVIFMLFLITFDFCLQGFIFSSDPHGSDIHLLYMWIHISVYMFRLDLQSTDGFFYSP